MPADLQFRRREASVLAVNESNQQRHQASRGRQHTFFLLLSISIFVDLFLTHTHTHTHTHTLHHHSLDSEDNKDKTSAWAQQS
jgi:hypothetical protein